MVYQKTKSQTVGLTAFNHFEKNIQVFALKNDNEELYNYKKDFFKAEEPYLKTSLIVVSLLMPWIQELREGLTLHIPMEDSNVQMKEYENKILKFLKKDCVFICPIIIHDFLVGIVSMDDCEKHNEEYDIPLTIATFITDRIKNEVIISESDYISEYLKSIDIYTGAFNRNYYMQMLMNKENISFYDVGILHLDFNEIRKLNEIQGFEHGDRILKKISKDLIECYGSCDSHVFRISGDEFLVICCDIKKAKFSKLYRQFSKISKKDKEYNVSVGSSYQSGSVEVFDLVLKAEKEMRSVKANYYDKKNTINRKQDLIKNLTDDLRQGYYSVYLQPKMDLNTEDLVGAEALVRKISKGTLYLPDTFIPYFEAEGVIIYLDLFVLEEVVKLIKEEEEKGVQVFTISTNFSRVTLMEKDIVSQMASVCDKYNVETNKICIEITESMNTMTMDELIELSEKIKAAGFKLSLDDYGSHYSNVTILANIDFDEVKLDKSIIQILHKNQKAKSIVSTTINMCKGFRNTQIVAEGIETKETLDILKAFNCDYGQGFYFSEAISMEEFKKKYILKRVVQRV